MTTTDPSPLSQRLLRAASSIRLRLVVWYIALLTLALAASILAVRTLLVQRVDTRINRELVQEIEELRTLADGVDPETGQPFGDRADRIFEVFLSRNIPAVNEAMLTFIDGQPFLRSVGQPPVRLDHQPELTRHWSQIDQTERGAVATEAGRVEYLAVPLQSGDAVLGVFVVAIFRDLELAEVDAVVRLASSVGAVALVIASLIAFGVAGQILAPVRELTATARRISDTDLARRIEVTGSDELAELAATFNGMLDRLEHAFGSQRAFLDDAGHELRTPITIIRGHLELMGDDPAEREEVRALVLDELARMHRIVEDLLLLAKAKRPDFLRYDMVDVTALTREVLTKAQALAPRSWRADHQTGGRIVADRQRLTQALVQLAQNATDYTADGAAITIGSAVLNGEARLWVRDSGPGIPWDEQQQIFDRFTRGAQGQRAREGSGLGLAIVRAVALAHRGRIELDSAPGRGATFTIVVPVDHDVAALGRDGR